MPVNGNLGNISYVLCAVMGGVLASNGYTGLTLGALISFLTLNRNFTQPITQISQQINSIVMAGAGAARVFALMDEKPETDEGYVELVNAKRRQTVRLRRLRREPVSGHGSTRTRRTTASPIQS